MNNKAMGGAASGGTVGSIMLDWFWNSFLASFQVFDGIPDMDQAATMAYAGAIGWAIGQIFHVKANGGKTP